MAVVVNTNVAALTAASNLTQTNTVLQRSLEKLSSGYKVNHPGDDAGGLAVSMKMEAAIKRNIACKNNIGNAVSFLQTQDGAMDTITQVLQRISELKLLYSDGTKSNNDKSNYDTEFTQLTAQLINLLGEKFNGVSIFGSASGSTITVITSDDGTQTVDITKAYMVNGITTITNASSLANISVGDTTTALQNIATMRAQNGAETNRLEFAAKMLTTNEINLRAANSRIKDADMATESTEFSRQQILSQSGASMLAQANTLSQVALRLLQ